MRNSVVTLITIAAAISIFDSPLFAVIWLDDGQIHDIDYEIVDTVIVDQSYPENYTTVNLLEGGVIAYEYPPGGGILCACEDSIVNIFGGSIHHRIEANDRSQVYIFNGSIGFENPDIGGVIALDYSQVHIYDGSIYGMLYTEGYTQVYVSGGRIDRGLWLTNNSQVYISGGSIGLQLNTFDNSMVDISGGQIDDYLCLNQYSSSVITIHGSGFAVDGVPVSGELNSQTGDPFLEPVRHLTGTLKNSELIDNDFYICDIDAKIVLVDESMVLEAVFDIITDPINSKTKSITCYIWPPEGYDVTQIDLNSIRLDGVTSATSTSVRSRQQMVVAKFPTSALSMEPGTLLLTISGELTDETEFEGSDSVTVIQRGKYK